MILVPEDEYARLLRAALSDESILWCQTCGAWIDREDPAAVNTEDFTGCLKVASGQPEHDILCRSHRAREGKR